MKDHKIKPLMPLEPWTKPKNISEVVKRYLNCPKDIEETVKRWTKISRDKLWTK